MAKLIAGPVSKFTLNGTDLSDHVQTCMLEDNSDDQDTTGWSEQYREHTPGMRDAQCTVTFFQDYASGSVDATVGGMYYARTSGTIKVTPDTGGTVVYTLVAKVLSFPPFGGGVGDPVTTDVTFVNASTAGLTRGTA